LVEQIPPLTLEEFNELIEHILTLEYRIEISDDWQAIVLLHTCGDSGTFLSAVAIKNERTRIQGEAAELEAHETAFAAMEKQHGKRIRVQQ
jgi:hypothetical protein